MRQSTASYRTEIDGFRALAVLAVIFHHFEMGPPGGYVGVDLFFVISGFLITGVIAKQVAEGRFTLRQFWLRRIRRLWPAHAVHLAGVALAAWFLLLPTHYADFGLSLAAQPLLASNLYFWRTSVTGYFGEFVEYKPLLHTWSLAVEEQYYLLYPMLLLPLLRAHGRVKAFVLLLVFTLSYGFSIKVTPGHAMLAFFCLPARICELTLGACVYFLPKPGIVSGRICGFFGLALVSVCLFWFPSAPTGTFPGGLVLFPALAMALLLRWQPQSGPFVWTPVILIGQASYSLYLWHWPVWAFSKYCSWAVSVPKPILLAIAFALGFWSWKYVETPVREGRVLAGDRSLFRAFVISSALFVGLGGLIYQRQGLPDRFPPQVARYEMARQWSRVEPEGGRSNMVNLLLMGRSTVRPNFVLWGDSHAGHLSYVFEQAARRQNQSFYLCYQDGAVAYQNLQHPLTLELLNLIQERHPAKVFLSFRWPPQALDESLEPLLSKLRALHVRPVVVLDVPLPDSDLPIKLSLNSRFPHIFPLPKRKMSEWRSEQLAWLKASRGPTEADFLLLDRGLTDPEGNLRLETRGIPTYWDTNHLTIPGSMLLLHDVEQALK